MSVYFEIVDETFVKGNVEVSSSGVTMRDNPKSFELLYEDLEIGDMIGRGSSGIVLHAYHQPSHTPLALKVMNTFEKDKRDQLFREICTLYDAQCARFLISFSLLSISFIFIFILLLHSLISFYGAFYREGTISIALEYMDGGSLANLVDQLGPIPEEVMANMAFQVLWGLAYLHHEKRVHRDIKPSNILINSQGEVKVTDFGISAQLANSIAMCGTFVGTFKFMSPERIQHEPYGYASDIWSLGLSIVECVTGQYPYPCTRYLQERDDEDDYDDDYDDGDHGKEDEYRGGRRMQSEEGKEQSRASRFRGRGEGEEDVSAIDLVQMILDMDPPSLHEFDDHEDEHQFSSEFEEFIESCLHKDPTERSTAEDLLSSPFMTLHGAYSYDEAVENVKEWINCLQGK